MATWWIMPAVLGGLMMYGKAKASAAFRWIMSTEDAVLGMPVALLLTKVNTGEALPAAPEGFRWKPVDINYAASPFAAPSTISVNVLEQWLNGVAKPSGVSGFLTSQAVVQAGGMGFVPGQILPAGFMAGFLDKETLAMSPHMGEVVDRRDYLYAPQTAPDFGGVDDACCDGCGQLGSLGKELLAKGLRLRRIGAGEARRGDTVVYRDGRVAVANGPVAGGLLKAAFRVGRA